MNLAEFISNTAKSLKYALTLGGTHRRRHILYLATKMEEQGCYSHCYTHLAGDALSHHFSSSEKEMIEFLYLDQVTRPKNENLVRYLSDEPKMILVIATDKEQAKKLIPKVLLNQMTVFSQETETDRKQMIPIIRNLQDLSPIPTKTQSSDPRDWETVPKFRYAMENTINKNLRGDPGEPKTRFIDEAFVSGPGSVPTKTQKQKAVIRITCKLHGEISQHLGVTCPDCVLQKIEESAAKRKADILKEAALLTTPPVSTKPLKILGWDQKFTLD